MLVHAVSLSATVVTIQAPAHWLARGPHVATPHRLHLLLPVLPVVLPEAVPPWLLFPPSMVSVLVVAEPTDTVSLIATFRSIPAQLRLLLPPTGAVVVPFVFLHIGSPLVHKLAPVASVPAAVVSVPAGNPLCPGRHLLLCICDQLLMLLMSHVHVDHEVTFGFFILVTFCAWEASFS